MEARSDYLGYVTPASESELNIISSILIFLQNESINTQDLRTLGSDVTMTKSRFKKGIISYLQIIIEMLLPWVICLVHENEKSFQKLPGNCSIYHEFIWFKIKSKLPIIKVSKQLFNQ
uniref:Solute carrier family 46 member 3like [Hydra vulgaris] n=1 Tax=Lepeophtheirus salmonis TaxID=72036 RepID=A0A0K2T280_LEPSM